MKTVNAKIGGSKTRDSGNEIKTVILNIKDGKLTGANQEIMGADLVMVITEATPKNLSLAKDIAKSQNKKAVKLLFAAPPAGGQDIRELVLPLRKAYDSIIITDQRKGWGSDFERVAGYLANLFRAPLMCGFDFADFESVFRGKGLCFICHGNGNSLNGDMLAKVLASRSLKDCSPEGARNALLLVMGGENMALGEVLPFAQLIEKSCKLENIKHQCWQSPKLGKDEKEVFVVFSGM